jgi:hypothetical protein
MRRHYRTFFLLLWATMAPEAAVAAAPEAALDATRATSQVTRGGNVTVEKTEVVVERKTFDPRNPPSEMPPLGPRADAFTRPQFGCSAVVNSTVTSRTRTGRGGCTCTKRIEAVKVQIDLTVVIWTPNRAKRKLVDHEEGHRMIAECIYEEVAAKVARAEAETLVGRTVSASGDDSETAAANAAAAVKEAAQEFSRAYMEATAKWSSRVGNRYDQITSHGKRDDPGVEESIRLAFKQEPQRKEMGPERGGK